MVESGEDNGLASLYQRVRVPLAAHNILDDDTLQVLLLHAASQRKLRLACATVLRQWSRRYDLCADVMQEASYLVTRRCVSSGVPYEDSGCEHFGGWLYQLWRRACQQAWRRYRSVLLREHPLDVPHAIPSRRSFDEDLWASALTWMHRIADPHLRDVMLDWAAGVERELTAARLGISKPTVTRLRHQGAHWLRSRLEGDGRLSSDLPE